MERFKPPEYLQAQAEAFGDKGVKEFSDDQKKILQYSAELAQIQDLDNLPEDIPAELRDLIERNKQKYISFLKGEKKEEIEFRKQNVELYKEKFQESIRNLKERMKQGNIKDLPEYLGSGSRGSAFRIEVDGQEYAAKFSSSITQSNFEIKPLLRAKGVEHTAQLVAYSFEDEGVIMNLLPGTEMERFTPEEAPEIKDEHIIQLIETTKELYNKGIVVDPKPSNFLYDPEEGFSLLDFHLAQGMHPTGIGDVIISLKLTLTKRKFPNIDWKADDYEEIVKDRTLQENKIFLPMMIRFLHILQERYPEILADYRRAFDERAANPRVSQSPLIHRQYIPVDHPDLKPYLDTLAEMGF